MSYTPPYTISNVILDLVGKISGIIAKYEVLEPKIVTPQLRKEYKIQTITGTLEIEGNTLGIEKVTAILEGKRVLGNVREIAEVKGAIQVYDNLNRFNPQKMSDLLLAHQMLMGDILTNAGAFRTKNVGVGGESGIVHIAPPHTQVNQLMVDLFNWLKSTDTHPFIQSCVFHYELEFIHPFIDGNGRIGRLWQTLILHQNNAVFSSLPVESVIREHQQAYYDALEQSGKAGDSTQFIEFMLGILHQSIDDAIITDQATDQVTDQVRKLIQVIGSGWISRGELMDKLALSHRPTFRDNYLNPAIELRLVELQYPDTPRNPKQKYRLRKKNK